MVTVSQFIESLQYLSAGKKTTLEEYVLSEDFGAKLDGECDEVFQEGLQQHPPATFNVLDRTSLKRALKQLGEYLNCRRSWFYFCSLHTMLCAQLSLLTKLPLSYLLQQDIVARLLYSCANIPTVECSSSAST